ncbi:HlyC/CorC family transporter [Granulosicoccus antarcticus]|uniref:Magnesium and cobalt efflux protein CorC n=1 Tax=Granulosicoccus antarcticus IMCC3135 TaxID=1192854 RepID=A0A2Z2P3T1_9GAMM|nr:HlyC/CorC family transporter [Granulosicoccus antarcticus]ASJ76060.1 Magnesium and cobalt efflux protein CorC [Granulosicoccus antarcticus IMCC3135]
MNSIPISALFSILVLLVLISGFFSGSETALMTVNRYRLRHQANNGHKAAQRTAKLLENPDRLISLILLGNNFVNISASAIATVIALRLMGEAGIAIATGLLTIVILVFAEVTPKTFATRRAEQFAFLASAIYGPLMTVTYPLVVATNWISSLILKLLKTDSIPAEDEHLSSEELRTVLNETAGMVPQRHRDMLLNILDLGTVSVNDIMVPRNEIVGIDLSAPWDEVLHGIINSPHSRVMVYREDVDNVVGFLYLRKMLDALRAGKITREYVESVVRDPYFIPEGTTLTVQLLNFQRERRRVGLVVDEYGDIQGLLTLEEILEEIVGEFDNDPHVKPAEIRPQPDGSFIVDGTTQVRNLNKSLNWSLPSEGPKTLNGIVVEHFENFPPQGAVFTFNGHPITILAVEDNKVQQVRIEPADFDEADEDAKNTDIASSS